MLRLCAPRGEEAGTDEGSRGALPSSWRTPWSVMHLHKGREVGC
jgi:hypothetical protein